MLNNFFPQKKKSFIGLYDKNMIVPDRPQMTNMEHVHFMPDN